MVVMMIRFGRLQVLCFYYAVDNFINKANKFMINSALTNISTQ